MPSVNMGSPTPPAANPSTGLFVIMSPFSGPKNSPFDARTITGYGAQNVPTYANDPNNFSTGALQTGIGFGSPPIINPTAPQSIKDAGFSDDYTPGITMPGLTAATTAILTAIGGGKSAITAGTGPNGNGFPTSEMVSVPSPYVAQPLLAFGNGASRDAGAGPAFTGFGMKTVTAVGTVANGGVVETGFTNRSGGSIATGYSVFGSDVAASPAVT